MKMICEHRISESIDYFGFPFLVPEWVKYVTTDEEGHVYGWAEEPYCFDGHWFGFDGVANVWIASVELEGEKPEDTKRYVTDAN